MNASNSISKKELKFIRSLKIKKYRHQSQTYLVEGINSVREYIRTDLTKIKRIYLTEDIHNKIDFSLPMSKTSVIPSQTYQQISLQKGPQGIMALIEMPSAPNPTNILQQKVCLCLDNIQDPGNLGTLIRIADWYGLSTIVCSRTCVDCYNPKVAQSSVGSLARIQILYTDLDSFLAQQSSIPIYGAALGGHSLYTQKFDHSSCLVLGNEGNGLSEEVKNQVNTLLEIPRLGKAESLNVAVSGGIFLAEIFRQIQN